MLDDINVIQQRDPSGALDSVIKLTEQTSFMPEVIGEPDLGITSVVIAGMGGSALAADMVKVLAREQLSVPFEIVKGYDLPAYVNQQTLVVAISHSGNTEETLGCYDEARQIGAKLAVMATGGKLLEKAKSDNVLHSQIPTGVQPRMLMVYHLRILLHVLQLHQVIDGQLFNQVADSTEWLAHHVNQWSASVPTEHNYAKQLATQAAGKTAIFYGGQLTAPLAYKWKISWNESSKNLAFWNQYPEFNHNEFIGWVSHPVDKPFAVFDLRSHFERPRVIERMELTDRLLSGKRPKATVLQLQGENLVQQMLWGLALADATSIYLGILNNVDPAPVEIIERFKKELS